MDLSHPHHHRKFAMKRGITFTLMLLLAAITFLSQVSHVDAMGMSTGMVGNGTTLRIAVVVNCLNSHYPHPVPGPHLIDLELIGGIAQCDMGFGLRHDWMAAYQTFERVVRDGGGIPSATGFKVALELIYFNVGGIDYTANGTTIQAQYIVAVQNSAILAQTLGAYGGFDKVTNAWNATCTHCPLPYGPDSPLGPEMGAFLTPGLFGRFPIIIPPTYGDIVPTLFGIPTAMTDPFFVGCQLSKSCIVVSQFSSSDEWMKCKPQLMYNAAQELEMATPPECFKANDPTLPADKRFNARRFDYGYSLLPAQTAMMTQVVSWFRFKQAQSAVVFITSTRPYTAQILPPGLEALRTNNIELKLDPVLLPPSGFTSEEVEDYAQKVMDLNPDLVFCIGHPATPSDPASCMGMMLAWKKARWTPKAIILPSGLALILCDQMNAIEPGSGGYLYGTTFNDVRLRGPNWNAVDGTEDEPNWEAFPSSPDGMDFSPQTFHKEYIKDWNETTPSMDQGTSYPLLVTQVLNAAAKLFYAAGTDDATAMQLASLSISTPSLGGLLQFDQYGRIAQNDQFVIQHGPAGEFHLITPLDVGEPDVYPMPTWEERISPEEGSSKFLGMKNEIGVVAITTVVNLYMFGLLISVFRFREVGVIKSSSPAFCYLTLIGGMVCVSSNYGHSLHALREGCGASAWLLTTGFALMFSALFAKTWRVYRIWKQTGLHVTRISTLGLYALVLVIVGIVIVTNSIWSGVTGFPTEYIVVDRDRPSKDYIQCAFSSTSLGFVYFHLAYAGVVIVCGLGLTIAARHMPSSFNETPYIATSIYNCTLLMLFVIPLVATKVGDRETTYLIRSYGILLVVASTVSVLFIPKFELIARRPRASVTQVGSKPGGISPSPPNLLTPSQIPELYHNSIQPRPNSSVLPQVKEDEDFVEGGQEQRAGGGPISSVHIPPREHMVSPAPGAGPASVVGGGRQFSNEHQWSVVDSYNLTTYLTMTPQQLYQQCINLRTEVTMLRQRVRWEADGDVATISSAEGVTETTRPNSAGSNRNFLEVPKEGNQVVHRPTRSTLSGPLPGTIQETVSSVATSQSSVTVHTSEAETITPTQDHHT